MVKLLVTGFLPFDSGKTTIVKGLINSFSGIGLKPLYFKPVGGHSGWYQLDTIIHSLELGYLIGHDAYIVGKEAGLLDYMDMLSPIDFLTLPIDPLSNGLSIRKYMEYMNNTLKITVLLRYTRAWISDNGISRVRTYIVCRDTYNLLNNYMKRVVDELIDSFRGNGSVILDGYTGLISKILDNEAIYSMIDEYPGFFKDYNVLVIEGYNDVAAPTRGSMDVNYVLVTAPTKALLYSGERYRNAINVSAYMGKPWTMSVSRILPLLGRPVKSWDIPFMDTGEFSQVVENITNYIIEHSG